ncbi:MAG: alpha/beta hydrolase [Atribacterota bacterium]|nr:alpha/beta hydrolase [Atribacterota bacterium]MDD5497301.1 alpha/beta hydrolase [Atribacterota bacterium]
MNKDRIALTLMNKKQKLYILVVILLLVYVNLNLFIKIGWAYTQWNDIQIYADLNYYQDNKDTEEVLQYSPEMKAHLLDIYRPKSCYCCPVMVYVHGGTWVLGDKGGLSYKAKAFTAAGFIYISINYRLSPDYSFPAQAYDVARAFSWIRNNIADYGGNPEQIYLLGHSAGGHLAALIALDERYLSAFDLNPSVIAGVIGLDSAAYHLPSLFAAEPENQYLFSWAFGDNPVDWETASPINYIREGQIVPPFLLLVAGDREVSKIVNNNFYQHLSQYNYDATIFYIEEKDHVSIDYDLGKEGDPVFQVILNWLKRP